MRLRLTDAQKTQVVSIHASVKDATRRQKRAIAAQRVSIHASVKDATANVFNKIGDVKFQSTHL